MTCKLHCLAIEMNQALAAAFSFTKDLDWLPNAEENKLLQDFAQIFGDYALCGKGDRNQKNEEKVKAMAKFRQNPTALSLVLISDWLNLTEEQKKMAQSLILFALPSKKINQAVLETLQRNCEVNEKGSYKRSKNLEELLLFLTAAPEKDFVSFLKSPFVQENPEIFFEGQALLVQRLAAEKKRCSEESFLLLKNNFETAAGRKWIENGSEQRNQWFFLTLCEGRPESFSEIETKYLKLTDPFLWSRRFTFRLAEWDLLARYQDSKLNKRIKEKLLAEIKEDKNGYLNYDTIHVLANYAQSFAAVAAREKNKKKFFFPQKEEELAEIFAAKSEDEKNYSPGKRMEFRTIARFLGVFRMAPEDPGYLDAYRHACEDFIIFTTSYVHYEKHFLAYRELLSLLPPMPDEIAPELNEMLGRARINDFDHREELMTFIFGTRSVSLLKEHCDDNLSQKNFQPDQDDQWFYQQIHELPPEGKNSLPTYFARQKRDSGFGREEKNFYITIWEDVFSDFQNKDVIEKKLNLVFDEMKSSPSVNWENFAYTLQTASKNFSYQKEVLAVLKNKIDLLDADFSDPSKNEMKKWLWNAYVQLKATDHNPLFGKIYLPN